MTVEMSKGRPRPFARTAGGDRPSLPQTVDAAPERDPETGQFLPANRAARRRTLRRAARGLATLNPAACATWLQPHVRDAGDYAVDLAAALPDHPALLRLAGDAADAAAVYRALLALGAQGDHQALDDARGWLREHRACLLSIAALAKDLKVETPKPDPLAGFYDEDVEEPVEPKPAEKSTDGQE